MVETFARDELAELDDRTKAHNRWEDGNDTVVLSTNGDISEHDREVVEDLGFEIVEEGEKKYGGRYAVVVKPDNHAARLLAKCIRETTAARGADLWACDKLGFSDTEWAELTGRDRSTVSRNVRRARGDE